MCGQNCQMRRIWSYFWHQTVFPYSFPGTSVLFLYRNVKETVVSFQRVMAAFTTLARFFTNDQVIYFLKDKRDDNWPYRRWTSGGWMTYLCLSPTPPTDGPETRTCWWEIPRGTRKGENSIESTQDQLSMPAAMALNYCCTAACVRDYIKQGLNISCLDYKYTISYLYATTICGEKPVFSRDLVARPEEAWASLASYCGLDPTNAKPLEAHKKFVSVDVFNNF